MKTIDQIRQLINSNNSITINDICNLGISRQMAHRYIKQLLKSGEIEKIGEAPHVQYQKPLPDLWIKTIPLSGLDEMQAFEEINESLQLQQKLAKNVYRIISYAFTEILNNAIDHSQGKTVDLEVQLRKNEIYFSVEDNGIGIFNNIQQAFQLRNQQEAMQELLKGKNTTDASRHSGEGIFFTSKIADQFFIETASGILSFQQGVPEWKKGNSKKIGTKVIFLLNRESQKSLKNLFENYTNEDFEFDTTSLYVKVFEINTELVSRSQAKRITNNLQNFEKVILDFSQVEFVGQGFVDELFRVFPQDFPNIQLEATNMEEDVEFMIKRAQAK